MKLPPYPKESDVRKLTRAELDFEFSVASEGSMRREMIGKEIARRDRNRNRRLGITGLLFTFMSVVAAWIHLLTR